LKEDLLSLLLQTEDEYHSVIKDAIREAEEYVYDRRKEQAAFIEELKQDLHYFEIAGNEQLERALAGESEKLEKEAARLKKSMKTRQEEKAEWISELLKEEVLSLLWR